MLTIGVKKDTGFQIIAPDGTVISVVMKNLMTSRATVGIEAPIEYKITRTPHRTEEEEDQQPLHQERKPECLG